MLLELSKKRLFSNASVFIDYTLISYELIVYGLNMKVAHKVVLLSSIIVVITFTVFSWVQYHSVKQALYENAKTNVEETSKIISSQVAKWLNDKLALIDIIAQSIDGDYSAANIQKSFDNPILKENFLLIFGGLDNDGKAITNSKTWQSPGWDARKRPWYGLAKKNDKAVLTAPYTSSSTKKMLISAVANISNKGQFKGAFGGDISLEVISKSINQVSFNQTGYAFLVNKNNLIISHPEAELNGQQLAELFPDSLPNLSPEFQEQKQAGEQVFVAFQPLSDLTGNEWFLGIVLNKGKVFAEATAFGVSAVIGAVLSALICSLALFYTISKLLSPLKNLNNSLVDINRGDGNLTKRLNATSADEFGKVSVSFNQFIAQLQGIVIEVKELSNTIRENTEVSSVVSSKSSQGLLEQLQKLDSLSSAVTMMNSEAENVANHAQSGADLAQNTDQSAANGTAIMLKTSSYLKELISDMEENSQAVNQLKVYSDEIESVLTSITGIAEQTNLLALNAAIEAARAGESGRGFAVVADEVRALAVRTQQSTDETSNIIKSLQAGVASAVDSIGQSQAMAGKTSDAAIEADVIFNGIRESIADIKKLTTDIASAAQHQRSVSQDIDQDTQVIREISQGVYDQAQKQSSLCDTMVASTNHQESVLKQFKV